MAAALSLLGPCPWTLHPEGAEAFAEPSAMAFWIPDRVIWCLEAVGFPALLRPELK